MKLPISEQSHLYPSLQPESKKTPSDFWKAVRTNLKLQHQTPPIKPVPRSGNLPLSFAQERLWFLDQMQPGSSIHNMPAAFRLKGSLNVAVLEKSLKEIVLRHEILRTTFPSVNGQPVQSISPKIDLKLSVVDLQDLPEPERETEAQRLALEETERPFDLSQGPLMHIKLLRLAEEEYWLLRTVHHIVFDGWSYSVFMRELAVAYEAFSVGKASPLTELPIQYADFAKSQRQWLRGEVLESQLHYWQQQFSGNLPALELPIDRPRQTFPNYQGASQYLLLSENLTKALKALSHREGVSLFVTLLAAFKTLFYRYTSQEDILICSPVSGRHRVETKRLIGYFNNIVVLRTDLSGNPNFRELLRRVSQTTLGALDHQDLPFQKLAEFPNLARIPLNRAMFALQNTLSQPLSLANIAVSSLNLNWGVANFDFSLSMNEYQGKLIGLLQYKTTLFDATTITQMLEHFQTLLETIVTNPDQCLEDLRLLISNGKIEKSAFPAPDRLRQESASTFVPPSDDLEIQLTKIWENVLGKKPIGVKDNFFEVGGHSLLAVPLFAQIEKTFGKNLPLATLFQAPNIEELANILRQKGWSAPWQTLVAIQPGGSKPPLFCIHPIGGNVLCYRTLAHYLGEQQPVYGLQAVGLDGKQAPYKRVEDMAAHYIREIRASQPEGPYLLAGHSAAGMVAFEIAQQLVAGGQKVAVLALLDAYSPQSFVRELPPGRTLYINFLNLLRLRPEDKLPYIKQRAVWLHGRITRKIAKTFNLWMRRPSTEDSHPYALITEAFSQAIRDYVPQVYPGQATLFRTRHQPTGVYYDPLFGWGSLVAGGLEIRDVPGLHLTLLTEPCVRVLGEKLRGCIDEALEDVLEGNSSEPKKSTTEVEYQTNFLNQERG